MTVKSALKKYKRHRKLKKTGYLSDQLGITNRYVREKENWDKHIENSKTFILKSSQTKEKGKIVVLGSGWLLDLPLAYLSKMFHEVILVDITHPIPIKKRIAQYPNVSLEYADITGGMVDYFYNTLRKLKKQKQNTILPAISSFEYSLPPNTDFVISLNIMCQLQILLVDYIKQFKVYTNKDLEDIIKIIQQKHIRMLPKNKTCLITEVEEEILDIKDQTIGVNPLILVDLPQGHFSQNWKWKFDSLMTYREDFKTYLNIQAIDL